MQTFLAQMQNLMSFRAKRPQMVETMARMDPMTVSQEMSQLFSDFGFLFFMLFFLSLFVDKRGSLLRDLSLS